MVAYLGLGSNLGDRQSEISMAVQVLSKVGRVVATSARYETLPEGGLDQPKYINAVTRMETDLSARDLLRACLNVERVRGRIRPSGTTKASRTIDIDLLLYGSDVISEPDLSVPHPALLSRPFVRILSPTWRCLDCATPSRVTFSIAANPMQRFGAWANYFLALSSSAGSSS